MSEDLGDLFQANPAAQQGYEFMFGMLRDPGVMQVTVNSHNRIFYTDTKGVHMVQRAIFQNHDAYAEWLNQLMKMTDVGYSDVRLAKTSVIEGSFDPLKTDIHGSIHIATKELTRGDASLTVRKQPRDAVTLDQMVTQNLLDPSMRVFLEMIVRGRANILLSGGSGAGKTTMARALSYYIDPSQRILTAEEIDELHLQDRLPNVVSLTTYKSVDAEGAIVRRVELEDLVREALRMRADRIWVGETRGREAYALVKAANSGHDGSVTTMHADNAQQAIKQVVTYVMESNLPEEVARDQVAQAFHIVIQIVKVSMGRRVISEITELEPVREGNEQRRNPLFEFDPETGGFRQVGHPSKRLQEHMARHGVNYDSYAGGAYGGY